MDHIQDLQLTLTNPNSWFGQKRVLVDVMECGKDLDWDTTKFQLLGIAFSDGLNKMPSLNYFKAETNRNGLISGK